MCTCVGKASCSDTQSRRCGFNRNVCACEGKASFNLTAVSSPTAQIRFALFCGQFSVPFLALRTTCSYVGVLIPHILWRSCDPIVWLTVCGLQQFSLFSLTTCDIFDRHCEGNPPSPCILLRTGTSHTHILEYPI